MRQYDAAVAVTQFNQLSDLHACAIGNEKAAARCAQDGRCEFSGW
ncbi:MAG: hypothetical protein NXI04_09015 [Planctomycetaceae bacterium]|nr:hypothetical protein [Planctomycetaceae bacterium]